MLIIPVCSTRPSGDLGETVTGLALADRWRSLAADLAATLNLWRRRASTRPALAKLSDEELKDIGLSRRDALAEAAKPFWRAGGPALSRLRLPRPPGGRR